MRCRSTDARRISHQRNRPVSEIWKLQQKNIYAVGLLLKSPTEKNFFRFEKGLLEFKQANSPPSEENISGKLSFNEHTGDMILVDSARIELAPPQCECGVIPLYYEPVYDFFNPYCHSQRMRESRPSSLFAKKIWIPTFAGMTKKYHFPNLLSRVA